jgi:hypothetical protein
MLEEPFRFLGANLMNWKGFGTTHIRTKIF